MPKQSTCHLQLMIFVIYQTNLTSPITCHFLCVSLERVVQYIERFKCLGSIVFLGSIMMFPEMQSLFRLLQGNKGKETQGKWTD